MEVMRLYLVGRYSRESIESLFNVGQNAESNFEIVNDINHADIVVSFDTVEKTLLRDLSKRNLFKVLVRLEPMIVIPENYKRKNYEFFNLIVDIGKIKDPKINALNWPQDLSVPKLVLTNRSERVVMVNSNLLSLHKRERYSLRRAAIKKIDQIDLYGHQWNQSAKTKVLTLFRELKKFIAKPRFMKITGVKHYFCSYQNFLGSVGNKRSAMANYKYSLIIENSGDYVSEKIFDSFLAGCMPIYVGPSLKNYLIPSELYFQAQPNVKSIREQINIVRSIDYQKWVQNVDIWLTSPDTYQSWSKDLFAKKLETLILKNYQ
jgi:hypothetical protein